MSTLILGQSIRTGHFGNFSSEFFNISDSQKEQVHATMNENVTVTDAIANISRQVFCSNGTLRDAVEFASVGIACGECG